MCSNDLTADVKIQMLSEQYRDILPTHIQPNSAKVIGWCSTVQMENDPKHTGKATHKLLKKGNIL